LSGEYSSEGGSRVRSLRFWLALVGSIIVLASVLTIVGVWIWNIKFDLPVSADKVTRINTVVAVSAYIAAIVAAIFALIAYWQTSGLPSLEPEISFLPFNSTSPAFTFAFGSLPPWVDTDAAPFPARFPEENYAPILDRASSDTIFTVVLKNKTKSVIQNLIIQGN
jgi:hypothetical protein